MVRYGIRGQGGWLTGRTAVQLAAVCLAVAACCLAGSACTQSERQGGPPIEPEMVLLPGGEFQMGKQGYGDYSPVHTVWLPPFHIDKYEVTNAQYQRFCEDTGRALPFFWGMERFRSGPDFPNHPVVGVSYHDALAYARWRGARLPTEAEWEYAARGGLIGQNYPHGDEMDSTLYVRGNEGPMPVGSFPANGFGLCDVTSNVAEWTSDRFDPDFYQRSPRENPRGPYAGGYQTIRGGGWHTGPYCCRIYQRYSLKSNWLDFNVGFRCAKYAGESAAERLEEAMRTAGRDAARDLYRKMGTAEPGTWYFDESELNEMGYRLVADSLVTEAVEVFELNVERFPDSYNAHDSLAETYALLGRREPAIAHYRKALDLYPGCATSRRGLEGLGVEP